MADEKVNILVVDDVPQKLLTIQAVLDELGENVVAVSSGKEALRQLLERDFAVILLDVNMPDMDGFETASLIRQRERSGHLPIIFITSYDDDTRACLGYSQGAVDYILAPVNPEVLRTKVGVFVELFRSTQKIKRHAEQQVALVREQAARAEAEATTRRSTFLAAASGMLARSLDFDATLEASAAVLLPRFADWLLLAVFEPQPERQPLIEAFQFAPAGIEARRRHLMAEEMPADLHLVLTEMIAADANRRSATGGRGTTHMASPELSFQLAPWIGAEADGSQSASTFWPLHARGRLLGALALASTSGREPLSAADRTLVGELASRAAIAIDNAMLYRAIQEHDRRKDEFLAMLGHELRNPLGAISNALQCISMADDDRGTDEAHAILHRQVQRMTRMVDDLLDVSRITRGKISLRSAVVDLSTIVRSAIASIDAQITARDLSLAVTLPREPVRLFADAARIEQVLTNLLSNSAKYTESGGQIWLTVQQQHEWIEVQVRDTGMGIPPRLLPRIFDLFAQGECSLDRSEGGLGIGLTLVKRLVEMHGGTVAADSPGLHQGTTFTVRLPLTQASLAAPMIPSIEPAELASTVNGRRILVVEDNPDIAATTAAVLRRIGHEVHVVGDGPSALVAALDRQPDAVLIDIGLPGMDGYEVAQRLQDNSKLARPLLVAISGYGQKEDLDRSRAAGFDHHLVKPVEFHTLQQILISTPVAR